METIFTAFYIKMCFSVLLTKKTLLSLLVWVGYWPSVPEYAPGQRSAVEYSISMYQRRPGRGAPARTSYLPTQSGSSVRGPVE